MESVVAERAEGQGDVLVWRGLRDHKDTADEVELVAR